MHWKRVLLPNDAQTGLMLAYEPSGHCPEVGLWEGIRSSRVRAIQK